MADQYRLEDVSGHHHIAAGVFVPFVVARLQVDSGSLDAGITVQLLGIVGPGLHERELRLFWSLDSVPILPLALPQRAITEWAACGVACVLAARYAELDLRHVAVDGDRFDYWVARGDEEFGLEVSGTIAEDVGLRHAAKKRQLLANPYGVDGYVVVVGFLESRAVFSFHRFGEDAT